MFTGIVTDVGTVTAVSSGDGVKRLGIDSMRGGEGLAIGASLAVCGICLTVVSIRPRGNGVTFEVDAAPETLALTTAGSWVPGTRVNLERALRIGDELGGHVVLGHVDGIATIVSRDDLGDSVRFEFEAPEALARFIPAKGSVALDGTSLTVNRVNGPRFECLVIPHTLAVTTWGERKAGDRVNLEADTLARYVARLMERP